ncbi:Rieske 2Fe-2S domain-containing protein [Dietzia maris]|uniref:Rieske 2Fe-2S domain-containing protein n=1 Tax=Dietzia maris TaxID=37915 RepID=UPI00232C5B7E|nr:Rieske 2Fe-2S domain-containing protein [Dietzia maris]
MTLTPTNPATTTDSSTPIREIESAGNPSRFARGWHCLGLIDQFRDGMPHQVTAFGTSLVVFDTSDGLKILDAYCRHMGGNLAKGTIKDDSIACPFHDWRWGGNGKCTAIPYAKRVPVAAKTRAWPSMERNGQLFLWHDPQRSQPTDEVTIPYIQGWDEGEWSDWSWQTFRVEGAHCREMIDNVVDMAHFFYVHGVSPRYFRNIFEGHVATQIMHSQTRPDIDPSQSYGDSDTFLRSEASYYGPSYMINPQLLTLAGKDVEAVLINSHYPIDNSSFLINFGIATKHRPGVDPAEAQAAAEAMTNGLAYGFGQDVEIWRDKARIDNPLLTEQDGPVYQLRRWYEQFYVDVEDIQPDMVERVEVEIDTDHAVAHWDTEIAENLAAMGRG